jgi:hypothetical protein
MASRIGFHGLHFVVLAVCAGGAHSQTYTDLFDFDGPTLAAVETGKISVLTQGGTANSTTNFTVQ